MVREGIMNIYQAGPLFSQAERDFHRRLSDALAAAGHKPIWPGDLLPEDALAAAGSSAPALIFTVCKEAMDHADCLAALLDGPQVDDGTAWEIGYAHARGLPVYVLRTDFRQAGDTRFSRVNSMIEASLAGLAGSVEELVRLLGSVSR